MRVFVFWVAVCLTNSALAQSTPALSPVRVSPQLSAEIGPHGRTYMACALQHIQRVATANPSTAFEQHEVSIRPACGAHINQIVLAFLRYGHPQENANLWIRNGCHGRAVSNSGTAPNGCAGASGGLRRQRYPEGDHMLAATSAGQ